MRPPVEEDEVMIALLDRYHTVGFGEIGPFTKKQHDSWVDYEQYMQEMEEEHAAQEAAGGRTICPQCGERSVKHSSVCTLGYPGHPGAEFSSLAKCEKCDYAEL